MGKPVAPGAGEMITVTDGAFSLDIPRALLSTLAADVNRVRSNGLVLVDSRSRHTIIHKDEKGDLPIEYTIALTVTRMGATDEERAAILTAKDASKANKDKRDKDAAAQHERDVQAALKMQRDMIRDGLTMGRADAVESIKNVAALGPSIAAIRDLGESLRTTKTE